jgi:hypothetical protein
MFTASYFNDFLHFNLKKQNLKKLLVINDSNLTTVEIIKDQLAFDNPPKRRAKRNTDRKENSRATEQEFLFVDLIAHLIIKSGSKVPAQGQ